METETILIRNLRTNDIDAAMALSAEEGWNQTQNDWYFFINNTCSTSIAAEHNGEIIATTAAINYSGKMIWIGMVLVNKAFRGKGISKRLLNHILKSTEDIAPAKLDATAQGMQVYTKFGFEEEYTIARLVNPVTGDIQLQNNNSEVTPARPEDISEILALDASAFGAGREGLIEMLVNIYPHKAWVLKREGKIIGFVLGRDGNRYHHIGPVTATSAADATLLLTHALKHLAGSPVVIDALCDKESLIQWLTNCGFTVQRNFSRMYRGINPCAGNPDRMFAIAGPEFG